MSPEQQSDLNQLAVFVKVAELRSFTAAARALGLQRSVVSRRVAALEDALGVSLLTRSTRRVTVTSAGRRLLGEVAPLLRDLDAAVRGLPERAEEPAGELRITAPADVGQWLLPPVLAALTARHHALVPVVHLSNRIVDLEREGFDVAIRVIAGRLEDSGLRARRLGDVATGLYAAPSYLEARGAPPGPEQLDDHVVIEIGRRGPSSRRRIVVDDMVLAAELAKQGAGLAVLPRFFVADDVAAGRLRAVFPEHGFYRGVLYAMFPSAPELPPKITAFRDEVVAFVKAHPLAP